MRVSVVLVERKANHRLWPEAESKELEDIMAFTRIRLWLRSFIRSQEMREGRENVRRVRPKLEALEDRIALATFTVTQNSDDGTGKAGTLSAAIGLANANPNSTIDFSIGVPGAKATITVTGVLPIIAVPTTVDGFSQGGAGAAGVWVELNGKGVNGDGISINSGGVTVQGLAIDQFGGNGIVLTDPQSVGGHGDLIQSCYIGTDTTGNTPNIGNGGNGILINGSNNTIGGAAAGTGNIIANNSGSAGILISGLTPSEQSVAANMNLVTGANSIGTNITGLAALPNNTGVRIDAGASNNTIDNGNIISGNNDDGVLITDGASSNVVNMNWIGVNNTGAVALPNGENGVEIGAGGAGANTIGSVQGGGNIISGNKENGVLVLGPQNSSNLVAGNLIGTDKTGTLKIANLNYGVLFNGATGGAISGNLISGNTFGGILITASPDALSTYIHVVGNSIGTDITGKNALGNAGDGILIQSNGNTIGAASQGTPQNPIPSNIISGNAANGIDIAGGSDNLVINNYIGTDVTGKAKLGNAVGGIVIQANNTIGSASNTIGGLDGVNSTLNVISDNTQYGIKLSGTNSVYNQILGDYIGVDVTGLTAMGNGGAGIYVGAGADHTWIGTSDTGAGNVISANSGWGVDLESSSDDVVNNSIGVDINGNNQNKAMSNTMGWLVDNGTNNNWKDPLNKHQ